VQQCLQKPLQTSFVDLTTLCQLQDGSMGNKSPNHVDFRRWSLVRLPELCALLDLFVDHSESNLCDKVQWNFTEPPLSQPPGAVVEKKVKLLKDVRPANLSRVLQYAQGIHDELHYHSGRRYGTLAVQANGTGPRWCLTCDVRRASSANDLQSESDARCPSLSYL
jgi:hypothetical protein